MIIIDITYRNTEPDVNAHFLENFPIVFTYIYIYFFFLIFIFLTFSLRPVIFGRFQIFYNPRDIP